MSILLNWSWVIFLSNVIFIMFRDPENVQVLYPFLCVIKYIDANCCTGKTNMAGHANASQGLDTMLLIANLKQLGSQCNPRHMKYEHRHTLRWLRTPTGQGRIYSYDVMWQRQAGQTRAGVTEIILRFWLERTHTHTHTHTHTRTQTLNTDTDTHICLRECLKSYILNSWCCIAIYIYGIGCINTHTNIYIWIS